jgi:hypothetical protein
MFEGRWVLQDFLQQWRQKSWKEFLHRGGMALPSVLAHMQQRQTTDPKLKVDGNALGHLNEANSAFVREVLLRLVASVSGLQVS